MFESANLDHRVSQGVYKREEPRLRAQLLDAQYDLKESSRFGRWSRRTTSTTRG